MTGQVDHVDQAKSMLGAEWRNGDVAVAQLAEAQVHATLALVEQQRIGNLIALMQMQAEVDEKTETLAAEAMYALIEYDRTPATPFSGPDEVPVVRRAVREALGL